jgi:hypothetical protein
MTSQRFLACTSGLLFAFVAFSGIASAQAPPEPKPGPEHESLKYFVGKWTSTGEEKPSPMGPGGKFTMTDNCELFSGGFFVVCKSTGKRPTGTAQGLGIMGYDNEKKLYTYTGIDSTMGDHVDVATGKKEGDVWTYTATMEMGGKKMQGRYIMNSVTPNSYAFKMEMAAEGSSDWQTMMEGKATRAGGAKMAKPEETMKKEGETPKKTSPDAKKTGGQ